MASDRLFISDCEGPVSKNDNAFELTSHFIPQGDYFFALASKYDDVLADVLKKPGYKAGYTLKLILPFLKTYGATNRKIKEYSAKNILLVPGAQETLGFVKDRMPSFMVSTSYEQYISSLCTLVGFPYENTYCTKLDLDKYEVSESEKRKLRKIREEISHMPIIELPENAQSMQDFSTRDQKTIQRLDEIFWKTIAEMKSGTMLQEVQPVGGSEKAKAVQNAAEKVNGNLQDVMYVGDSITDATCFRLVRENEGLTVSFNGNEYAIKEAEIAVLSDNTIVTSVLADTFNTAGKNGVINLVREWGHSGLTKHCANSTLRNRVFRLYPEKLPQVEMTTPANKERLIRESNAFRKKVRGEAIGRLG